MKRFLDLIIVVLAAPFWILAVLVLALLVRARLGSPVLFSQRRPGLNGRLFTLRKFRTMIDRHGSDGQPMDDSVRLGRFGRWLRSTSLDELPALWNVLRGDMSLVGPRPLLVEYLPLYSAEQSRRHSVRPGITGWAQVNGRNAISWERRFELDIWYVDNQSILLDLGILLLTVLKVFRKEGITQQGEATMQRFTGTPSNGPAEDRTGSSSSTLLAPHSAVREHSGSGPRDS